MDSSSPSATSAAKCNGCARHIDEGNVIAFGDHVWHLECFRCGKCRQLVEHDANLLLLADGSPVCEKCSYVCASCQLPIHDQAVLTGDTAYHEQCFKCHRCQTPIANLVFTKSPDGPLCVACASSDEQSKEPTPTESPSLLRKLPDSDKQPSSVNSLPGQSPVQQSSPVARESLSTARPSTSRSELSSLTGENIDILTSDGELAQVKLKLSTTERALEKIKTASRSAIEHFNLVRADLAREVALRQKFEAEVKTLRGELTRSNEQTVKLRRDHQNDLDVLRAEMEIAAAGLGQVSGLESRQLALQAENDVLQNQAAELTSRRVQLLAELDELTAVKRDMVTNDLDETVRGEMEQLDKRLRDKRHEFDTEMSGLYRTRTKLQEEILQLERTRSDLAVEVSRQKTLIKRSSNSSMISPVVSPAPDVPVVLQVQTKAPPLSHSPSATSNTTSPSTGGHSPKPNFIQRKQAQLQHGNQGSSASLALDGSVSNLTPSPSGGEGHRDQIKLFKFLNSGGNSKKAKELAKHDSQSLASAATKKLQAHTFQVQQFLVPAKCGVCAEKIWGMKPKDLQCRDCSYACHVKCQAKAAADCEGNGKPPAPPQVFGASIEALCRYENRHVPTVVTKCIDEVERRGLEIEGVYRKSGLQSQIKQLTDAFNDSQLSGADVDVGEEACPDIHVVCGCLKVWFRNLPVPVTTFDHFQGLVEASMMPNDETKQKAFVHILRMLTVAHYSTLRCLLLHLNKVASHFETNLMSYRNLSVVFGPNLLRSQAVDPSAAMNDNELTDMGYKNAIAEYMIAEAPALLAQCDKLRATDDEQLNQYLSQPQQTDGLSAKSMSKNSTDQFATQSAKSAHSQSKPGDVENANFPRNMNVFMLSTTVTLDDSPDMQQQQQTADSSQRQQQEPNPIHHS